METPLTLEEMKRVVERSGGHIPRVPLFWHKFYNNGTIEKYGEALSELSASVVDDCISLNHAAPGNFRPPVGAPPGYRWAIEPDPGDLHTKGITSRSPGGDYTESQTTPLNKPIGQIGELSGKTH